VAKWLAAQQLNVAWRSSVADFATHLGTGWSLWTGWTLWSLWTDLFSTQWPVVSRPQHSAFLGMVQLSFFFARSRLAFLTERYWAPTPEVYAGSVRVREPQKSICAFTLQITNGKLPI
jgi:hypothetical protein